MKKKLVVFSLVLLLSISFISAGWFEDIFWGEKNVQMSPSFASVQKQAQTQVVGIGKKVDGGSSLSLVENSCVQKCLNEKCSKIKRNILRKRCEKTMKNTCVKRCARAETNQTQINCIDSDGGLYFQEYGSCSDSIGTYYDACEGNILFEYYCRQNRCRGLTNPCADGCINGACVEETNQTNCTDSDGGKNYYVKGTTMSPAGPYEDYCLESMPPSDVVEEGPILVEHFCGEFGFGYEYHNCSCVDGACVSEEECFYYCWDADEGDHPAIFSGWSLSMQCFIDGEVTRGNGTFRAGGPDSFCENINGTNFVKELYCTADNSTLGLPVNYSFYECSDDCVDGRCVGEGECDYQIEEGETVSLDIGGYYYDVSISYISGNSVKLLINEELTGFLNEGESQSLSDGSKVYIENIFYRDVAGTVGSVQFCLTPPEEACSDTDVDERHFDGINYYSKGKVVDSLGNIYWDDCQGNILNEKYCAGGSLMNTTYNCLYDMMLCVDGECVAESQPTPPGNFGERIRNFFGNLFRR